MAVGKPVDQRGIAKDIDHPRDAAAGGGDFGRGLKRKHYSRRSGSLKAESDVIGDLALAQGLKVEVRRNSLRELVQLGGDQQVTQLRLPDDDKLQNLVFVRIDI